MSRHKWRRVMTLIEIAVSFWSQGQFYARILLLLAWLNQSTNTLRCVSQMYLCHYLVCSATTGATHTMGCLYCGAQLCIIPLIQYDTHLYGIYCNMFGSIKYATDLKSAMLFLWAAIFIHLFYGPNTIYFVSKLTTNLNCIFTSCTQQKWCD